MGADPRPYGGDGLTREVDRAIRGPANDPAVEEAVRGTRAASLPCELWREPWTTRIVGQIREPARLDVPRMDDGLSGQPGAMFVFFSNRLGCFGSLLVSAALTLVLLLILNVI